MIEKNSHYDVIIIGSGFAGIAAADILSDNDVNVLLIDENIHIGGQLLRKIPEELGKAESYQPDKIKETGFRFVEKVKEKKITIMNRATLLGVYPGKEILVDHNRAKTARFTYEYLLFATGARERFFPFKGWTLPGVYSAGMLQVLIKSFGVLPAGKTLIAGSGLFLFAAAHEYLKQGGELMGIMEQSPFMNKVQFFPQILYQLPKLAEGAKYLSKIYGSGVPVKYRRHVVEARGDKQLEEVVVAKLNRKGQVISGTEKTYSTQTLITGYGFVPNIEAPQMAGCALDFSSERGGWTVRVNDRLETSINDILAAGEITGVGGAPKSLNEGKIAAYTILEKMEKRSPKESGTVMKKLSKRRKHDMGFVKCFNSLYRIKPETLLSIPDDTVICRCESVDMKAIKDAVDMGCLNPNALKVSTRCTMGPCQGRTCGPVIYDILQILCKKDQNEIGMFSARPPLKPVSIRALNDRMK